MNNLQGEELAGEMNLLKTLHEIHEISEANCFVGGNHMLGQTDSIVGGYCRRKTTLYQSQMEYVLVIHSIHCAGAVCIKQSVTISTRKTAHCTYGKSHSR